MRRYHDLPGCLPGCCWQVGRVTVRQELPRNANNKVLRQALREELLRSQSKL